MGAVIKMILGRDVVINEGNTPAKRHGDRRNSAPGGTKRSWNPWRKPKNRETAGQLRNRSSGAGRQGPNASIHPYVCSEAISNIQLAF